MNVAPPKPYSLPRPTPWPAALAFGLCTMFFGAIHSMVILTGGGVLSTMALIGWIRELCLETR